MIRISIVHLDHILAVEDGVEMVVEEVVEGGLDVVAEEGAGVERLAEEAGTTIKDNKKEPLVTDSNAVSHRLFCVLVAVLPKGFLNSDPPSLLPDVGHILFSSVDASFLVEFPNHY